MKVKKVLRRLTKIETLLSDAMERCSESAPDVQEALQGAKVAFARVKMAVSSQASTETEKDPLVVPSKAAVEKKAPLKKAVARQVGRENKGLLAKAQVS